MAKSVVIIGGGIAGLSAANELLRRGCTVTVLEAKERFGGRIHTIREGTLPIELGAEFVHGKSKPLLKAIRAAGLSIHEVPASNRLFEKGKLRPIKIWDKVGEVMNRINPRAPDGSFQEFIDRQKIDARTQRLMLAFVQGFDAAHPERIGVRGLLAAERSAERMEGDAQGRVTEGYSALVEFFENEIRARGGMLVTRALVRRIRWKKGSVESIVHRAGGQEMFPAEAALVTLPIGIWKAREVLFEPALAKKQEAADNLQFGNVLKVTLVFRKQWWPKADFGFIQAPEERIPTWWSDPRGPVLTGWAGGPKADALLTQSPAQLETLALGILRKIFGAASLRKQLVSSHSYNWANDPHIRGAYSYIPVNGLELPKMLGAPIESTLFFAGEATVTDAQMGTVFGALESGLRAAREILKA
ncbi:MAG TPA: NAD(P)/FAD-dependent oxidoreductase [Verrucomicrobiae bacterium]|jgi:monoamine oxidase|nr:NAD(P)/FAD-dependent oxidoreductase [Verrucomicrobiae bacterium]